jgi:cell division protein FtsI (penicillin-binding protein 3)
MQLAPAGPFLGDGPPLRGERQRIAALALILIIALGAIAGQVLRLALVPRGEARLSAVEPIARFSLRPDIVDRNGSLIATDLLAPSLYADPALIVDLDEVVEKLSQTLPSLDAAQLRRSLADRSRRFQWIRRGLTPIEAQRVHELGLPGLAFRREPKRVYPLGALVGHVIGHVNVDNRGQSGIERFIDERTAEVGTHVWASPQARQVRLAMDLGVQHAVTDELGGAMRRFGASGAAGLVLEARSGEVIAAVSLPSVDPNRPAEAMDASRPDRLQGGVFELGSIFKLMTVAMALDGGTATLEKTYDTTRPIEIGRYTIRDLHPAQQRLSVRDIFLQSSNVGAGLMALEAGAAEQLAFLARMGLTEPIRTEAGPVAPPMLPQRWDRIETVTIGYGHGFAVAPIQFAAAAATLVNGGFRVTPRFLVTDGAPPPGERILSAPTVEALREVMRLNVTTPKGTGRRAEVAAYRVGGKTGTAEMPGESGYRRRSVIASFLGAFPMDRPQYVTLVSLFEPQPVEASQGQITAGVNAAPTTARIIERIAPILGVLPRRLDGAVR